MKTIEEKLEHLAALTGRRYRLQGGMVVVVDTNSALTPTLCLESLHLAIDHYTKGWVDCQEVYVSTER